MRLATPAQERPARNAPTAGFNCARIMWKAVAGVMRSSARPACLSIERSTRSPHMGNVESEKGPNAGPLTAASHRIRFTPPALDALD